VLTVRTIEVEVHWPHIFASIIALQVVVQDGEYQTHEWTTDASHETLILHPDLLGTTIELMVDEFYYLWSPKSISPCLTTITFSAPNTGFSMAIYIPHVALGHT